MSPEFLGAGLLIAIVGVFLWVGPVYFAMLLAATVVLATAYYKLSPYVSDLSYSAFWEHLQPGDTIKLAVCAAVLVVYFIWVKRRLSLPKTDDLANEQT